MTDKELIKLAAKSVGIIHPGGEHSIYNDGRVWDCKELRWWNPLADDGDALRLAVKLNLDIRYESYDAGVAVIVGGTWDGAPEGVHEIFERDGPRATRRAIVRAAAEIGRSIP